jgi:long-subunit acyl-CoA synthetase (AMP-forming)
VHDERRGAILVIDLRRLIERLPSAGGNEIVTYEHGKRISRDHATLRRDVATARAHLASWDIRQRSRVGIRAPNSYHWIVWDLAIIAQCAVSVAFTDDFAGMTPQALCERYGLSILLAGARDPEASFVAALEGDNTGVAPFATAAPRAPASDPDFDHPALIFSSGSAGGMKGMVLNRRGIESSIDSFAQAVGTRADDRLLLFLPMSNFQQRLMYYAALWYGFDLVIAEPARLFHALKDVAPSILIAPPTLYEAIETRVSNLPGWKRALATALAALAWVLPRPAGRALMRVVFKDVHAVFGPRMRVMVTGMAPIKRSTLELFRRMQIPLFETYGLIECGSVALNVPGANRLGSVGRLLPGVRIELADDGEIIVEKDHTVSVRYFECADGEQERTYLGPNRIATGDVGRLDGDGYLYLIGRKKEIIVTPGGDKIHPEAIEAELDACGDVGKAVVFSDDRSASLSAVVLPKYPDDSAAKRRIQAHIESINQRRTSMQIGRVVFTDVAFTRDNGLLRPNLKLDRKNIAARFRDEPAEPRGDDVRYHR